MEADIDRLGVARKPYFSAKIVDHGVTTEGEVACALGRRVPGEIPECDDGVFAGWRWDGERLVASNDRYGLYPLFYSNCGGEVRVSPSIAEVLRGNVSRRLDYDALSVFFGLGMFIGDATPFAEIRLLPPGSILEWCRGRATIREAGFRRTGPMRAGAIGRTEAMETYAHLFGKAVSKRRPDGGSFCVPLSGGRDSRHILFELMRQGIKPDFCPTVTYRPPATNEDARIAALMTSEFGIPHVLIDEPPSFHRAVVKDVHLTNYCGSGHAWILPVAAYLTGRVTTVYDGIAGDILSNGLLLSERKLSLFEGNQLEELALLLLAEANRSSVTQKVLSRDFLKRMDKGAAVASLVKELEKHVSAPNPVASFYFWNRTRRGIGLIPFSILSEIPVVHCPYLDHEVFDFLMSLDGAMFLGGSFHDETIHHAYPEFAHFPYEIAGDRPGLSREGQRYYQKAILEFMRYLVRRGGRPSALVRRGYVLPRALFGLLMKRTELPWYMTQAIYATELGDAC